MFRKLRNSLLSAAAVLAVAAGASNGANAALYQVGFLLDSSGSITASGWNTIRNGLANAIAAFANPLLTDQYELSVMSSSSTTQTIISPTIVTNANLGALQASILGQPSSTRTPISISPSLI